MVLILSQFNEYFSLSPFTDSLSHDFAHSFPPKVLMNPKK